MGRHYGKQLEALKWHGTICPKVRKRLQRHIDVAATCHADPSGLGIFEVQDKNRQFSVDITLYKCTCRRWNLMRIPCCHVVASARYDNIPLETLVHPCYSIETYRKAYEKIILPCKDVSEWEKCMADKCFLPKLRKRKVERRRTDDNKQKRPRVGQGGKLVEVELLCIALIVDLQDII